MTDRDTTATAPRRAYLAQWLRGGTAALLALALVPASAQEMVKRYPDKPIRLVVPLTPGSATDAMARYVANGLGKAWSVSITVDNKPGAGVILGTDVVAKSPADGYTMLFTYSPHYSQGYTMPVPYDAVKDFEPVAQLVDTQLVLAVKSDSPFRTLQDVIAAAKHKPGMLTYASAGLGTTGHMCGALFETLAGVKLNHVPYKAASQVPLDAASGQVDLMFGGFASALPIIKAGRLRVLAVTGAKRSALFPDVPAISELVPAYQVGSPVWLMAPRGTPKAIIEKWSDAVVRLTATQEFKDYVLNQGMEPDSLDATRLAANVPAEAAKWKRMVELTKASGQ